MMMMMVIMMVIIDYDDNQINVNGDRGAEIVVQ